MTDIDRRTLMKSAALGAAASALPLHAAMAASPEVATTEDPWWLLSPLSPGQSIAFGWRLGEALTLQKGAWVLPLVHESQATAQLHICLHGGVGRGVASTSKLDLLLMDGGDGQQATHEALGRIARYLGTVIATNEGRPEADERFAALMTHGERLFRYGGEGLT